MSNKRRKSNAGNYPHSHIIKTGIPSNQYRDNKGKIILTEVHKLRIHHAAYLRDICNRKDDCTPLKPINNAKLKNG